MADVRGRLEDISVNAKKLADASELRDHTYQSANRETRVRKSWLNCRHESAAHGDAR
jgi:hypothetical protein